MKKNRPLLVAFFALFFLFPLFSNQLILPEVEKLEQWYNYITHLYPIYENSLAEQTALIYIEDELKTMELTPQRISYRNMDNLHSFAESIQVDFKTDSSRELIFLCSLNSEGSDSFNPFLMLSLAKIFKDNPPPIDIRLIFLTGENRDVPLGTTALLAREEFLSRSNFIYLNFTSIPDEIVIKNGSAGHITPLWFLKSIQNSLELKDIEYSIATQGLNLYGVELENEVGTLATLLEEDLTAISLESLTGSVIYNSHRTDEILSFLSHIPYSIKQDWSRERDRNYYLIRNKQQQITIPEKTYVIILLVTVSLLLLIPLINSRTIIYNLKRFRSKIWIAPLLYIITFMFFLFATLIVEEIILIREIPELWSFLPGKAFLLKFGITIFFYYLFIFMVKGLPFSRNPHFYSYMSILSSLLNIAFFSLIDITLSLYFIWALPFQILFALSRNRLVRTLLLLIIPVPIFYSVYILFARSYLLPINFFLLNRLGGNIVLTLSILPLFLLFIAQHYLVTFYKLKPRKWFAPVAVSLFAIGSIVLVINMLKLEPYSQENPIKISIDEVYNLNKESKTLYFTSPAPIGDLQMKLDEIDYYLSDLGKEVKVEGVMRDSLLEVESTQENYLDRKSIKINITPYYLPNEINISIKSDKKITIYDSSFPYETSSNSRNATIFIGHNPPTPFEYEIVISIDDNPDIDIELVYWIAPTPLTTEGINHVFTRKMRIVETISIAE